VSNDCPRAGRWIGGCKFEARYDEAPAELVSQVVAEISRASDGAVQAIMLGNKKSIYVRDICTHCGKTIERGKE
jgi:hypothetical protein